MKARRPHRGSSQLGQALLEFALVLPVFTIALLGMVDVGRVIWANNSVANAAREAARYATVHGGSKGNSCPVGPPVVGTTTIPPASADCPYPSPSKEGIYAVARSFTIAGGTNIVVTACYGTGCAGDTNADSATNNARGTAVTVTVSSQVPMIVGSLLGLGSFDVSASSTMLVNH